MSGRERNVFSSKIRITGERNRRTDRWHVAARTNLESRPTARGREHIFISISPMCTIACSSFRKSTRCRLSARCRRKSTFGLWSGSRSPGSPEKRVSDPFASDVAFLVDARGVLMKEKKLLPEYLGFAADRRLHESIARGGENSRILRRESRARPVASEHAEFHADAFSDSRDRSFERLLPAGFGQEPHPGDLRLR